MSQENLKWLLKLCVVLPGIYQYLEIIFKEFNVEYKTLYIILPVIIKLKCTLSTGICRQDNLYFKTLRTSLNKILFYNVSTSLVFGETYYAKKSYHSDPGQSYDQIHAPQYQQQWQHRDAMPEIIVKNYSLI